LALVVAVAVLLLVVVAVAVVAVVATVLIYAVAPRVHIASAAWFSSAATVTPKKG
jgi:hypothetical protein